MIILALNCGSSSIKYQLYDWEKQEIITKGIVERIGISGSFLEQTSSGKGKYELNKDCPDHKFALELIMGSLVHEKYGVLKGLSQITAVGHRVVHGGEKFHSSVLITREVLEVIKEVKDLAPLHNPPNIAGIEAAQKVLPDIPHIAVFDTAFHQTMPEESYIYPLPYEWYGMYGIRRYGFHGTSHLYCSKRAARMLKKKSTDINVITLHIGNGVSITAIKKGRCLDTSMGMTPLEGAVMGTRCGDIDPAIPMFMIEKEGFSASELDRVLNKKSGLLGITGKYIDRRDIEKAAAEGDRRAILACKIEAYRLKKYIGAYAAAMGGVDAVVFTAGAGENNDLLRARVCEGLEFMGMVLDKDKNKTTKRVEVDIAATDSKVRILIIPTNEELVFVEDVVAILENRYDTHINFTYSFQDPNFKPK